MDELGLHQAEDFYLESRRRFFSKESDSITGSIVVPCSETADTKAAGIRAVCTDKVLKGCLRCSSNAQQASLLLLFVGNTNTRGALLGLGRNQCGLFLKSGWSTFPWKRSQKHPKVVKLKEKHLRTKVFNVF